MNKKSVPLGTAFVSVLLIRERSNILKLIFINTHTFKKPVINYWQNINYFCFIIDRYIKKQICIKFIDKFPFLY